MSSQDFFDRDPADLERYLIEQGRLDRPAEGVRKRAIVLSGLAASTASAGLATASIASGSSASALSWTLAAKWIAIGVASGMATIGAAEGLRYEQRSELTTPTAAVLAVVPPTARQPAKPMTLAAPEEPSVASLVKSPAEPLVAPGSQAMLAHAAPSETGATGGATVDDVNRQAKDGPRPLAVGKPSTESVVRDEAPPARPARQSGGTPNVETAPPSPGPSSPAPSDRDRDKSLKIELGFLDEARVALESHAGVNALRLLDDYAQQFPAGSMRIEAIALRIEALLVLGRRSDAQTLGNDFLARYPANPAAMRVRLLLGPRDNRPAKP